MMRYQVDTNGARTRLSRYVFDQLKFDAKAELLDQAARALRRPQLVVPDQRPLNRPDSTKLEQL